MIAIVKQDTSMFCCAIFEQVKTAVMLLALLMASTLLQAESSDNADTSDSAAARADAGLNSTADKQQDYKFPDWPKRKQSNRQMVPPPPPGPYMSSALSDFSVKGLSFGQDSNRHESNKSASELDPSNIPMETFSPDRPWVDDSYRKHTYNPDCPPACSPQRWMPENGYQYAPLVKRKLYSVVPNRMPGQLKAPDMNWPGSQLPSSRLPQMGSAPNGRYPYAPNYAPRYNVPRN